MRSPDQFVADREPDWKALDQLLESKARLHDHEPDTQSRIGALYRSVCSDLMRARAAGYDPELVTYLDGLAARAHNLLYTARAMRISALPRFVAVTFPRALRAYAGVFAIASTLFFGPLVLALVTTILYPEIATTILPKSMLEGAAHSYAEGLEGRGSGEDAAMAGFYVHNNVGIAFRCFATGILFGLGSIFFLVYNGVVIGIVIGWVIMRGHGEHILTFVCGHAPFELTAICIAGAAGIQMGYALVRTEGRTRLGSLRAHASGIGTLVGGAALMLLVAALVEGFWSPSSVAPPVKWTVATILTIGVAAYLSFAGRRATP